MKWKPTNEFRWLQLKPPFGGTHPSAFFPHQGAFFAHCLQQKWEAFEVYQEVKETAEGILVTYEGMHKSSEEWRDLPVVEE